jgi:hypothetical protein
VHFQTFRLQPPHAPPSSGHTSCSGRAWPPIRLFGLSAVLRISLTTRSLISRIRPYRVCVAGVRRPSVLRTIFSFPVALHIPSPVCSYFQLVAGSTATEGLPPSNARSLSSARVRPSRSQQCPNSQTHPNSQNRRNFARCCARDGRTPLPKVPAAGAQVRRLQYSAAEPAEPQPRSSVVV